MEWIFDHFQLVLGIIIVAGYILRGFLGTQSAAGEDPHLGEMRESAEVDTDEADRTRRIQEEIRRRILARQRGEESVQSSQRPLVTMDPFRRQRQTPPPIRQVAPVRVDPLADSASQAVLERQRQLEEKLMALRQSRESGPASMPKRPTHSWDIKSDRRSSVDLNLKGELRRPGSLRRAILLREILGQPLGLEFGPLDLPRR